MLGATVGVALLGTVSLALAQLGHHDSGLALVITAGLVGLGLAAARREHLHLARAPKDLALVAAVGVLGLVMFFPGFPYAYADKDPGLYVAHSLAIARDGNVRLADPVLAANEPGVLFAPGARFPGVWTDGSTDSVTPQFFHFFPALAATFVDLTDQRAAFHLNPLLATLSLAALVLAARRAFGRPTALITGALLAISMPEVWQAKYPSTEIVAQLLLGGAVLAGAIAVDRRSPTIAVAGGLLVGTGFLARPDGLLPVLIAAVLLGVLLAVDRFDRTVRWFATGLALSLPYAVWNAYHLRRAYTLTNNVPDLPLVALGVVGALVGGRLVRPVVTSARTRWAARAHDGRPTDYRRAAGVVLAMGFAGLLLLFAGRSRLLGEAYTNLLGPGPRRSYDEMNLRRLTWYLSWLMPPLAVLGLLVVGWRRVRPAAWIVLVPGLGMTPLYLWQAQISPRLMWWVRRYVPGVVPVLVLLMAIALAAGLTQRRWVIRGVAAALLVVLSAGYLHRSLPLRHHREMGGSYEAAASIASFSGHQQGLFLWQRPDGNDIFSTSRNVGAVVWLAFDQLSALLPADPGQAVVDAYEAHFPTHPVFVVSAGDQLPGSLDPRAYTRLGRVSRVLPLWEEQVVKLPQRATTIPIDVTIWQLDASGSKQGG